MGVYKRDSPFFWLYLDGHRDANGNPLREPTKVRHDAPTPEQRKDARALAEQLYHARMLQLAGGHPALPTKKPAITFGAFLTWWETHALPTRRGREREAGTIPRLRASFGDLPITAIDRELTQEWITTRLATPTVIRQGTHTRTVVAGPKTVNREVAVLKAILKAAVPKYLAASPLYGMPNLRGTTPKRRLMTEDEETRLLAVMAPDDKALFLLALDGLVRLTDCLDVKRTDDHGDTIWIGDPKAGGGFDVPVSRRLRAAIDALPHRSYGGRRLSGAAVAAIVAALEQDPTINKSALGRQHGVSETMIRKIRRSAAHEPAPPSPYLFPRRRRATTERDRRGTVRQMLKRYCRLADVPYGRTVGGLTFHWATRRTGTTRMLTQGHDLGTVQKVGGWKTPSVVLSIYHGLIDAKARAAVEAVSRRTPSVKATKGTMRKPEVLARQPASTKQQPGRQKR